MYMRSDSSQELLDILKNVGIITIESLVIRQTGSVERLFDSLIQLKKKGLVVVEGDFNAVEKFIDFAKKKEHEGLDISNLQEELYKILKGQPEVANANVRLTSRGLSRTRCY
jgi:hypothetical protein